MRRSSYHCVMPGGRQGAYQYGRRCLTKQEAEAYEAEVQRRFEIVMGMDPGRVSMGEGPSAEDLGDP